jgi:hypothetical protein
MAIKLTLTRFPYCTHETSPCSLSERWMLKMRNLGYTPKQVWDACDKPEWVSWILLSILEMDDRAPNAVQNATPKIAAVFTELRRLRRPIYMYPARIANLPITERRAYAAALKSLVQYKDVRAAVIKAGWR